MFVLFFCYWETRFAEGCSQTKMKSDVINWSSVAQVFENWQHLLHIKKLT